MKDNDSFLLNTDVLFETRREPMHPNVERFLKGTAVNRLFLSPLSLGELRRQTRKSRDIDTQTEAHFDKWLDEAKSIFEERLLPIDADVADIWSVVRNADIRSVTASLIAATAATNNLILVTRNAEDAAGMNVRTLNPWHAAYRTRPAPPTGDVS